MPRDSYRRRADRLPGEGGQGRGAPKGNLDGPVGLAPSLMAGADGPDGPDGPQVDFGLGVGHGACLTVPYLSLGEIAEWVI